jgi:hypothetical protein
MPNEPNASRVFNLNPGISLDELIEVVIPANEVWKLETTAWLTSERQIEIQKTFKSSPDGMTWADVIAFVGRTLKAWTQEFPGWTTTYEDEGTMTECHIMFWGDHMWLEAIELDDGSRTMRLQLGS